MRRLLATASALVLVGSATAFFTLDGPSSTLVTVAHTTATVSTPDPGQHIVVVANTTGPSEAPANINYLLDEIESRGLGVLILPEPDSRNPLTSMVNEAVDALQRNPSLASHPITLLAVGHDAETVWSTLADPPQGLVAAVTLNVPGVPRINFDDGQDVATLSLNVEADEIATESHEEVHEAMAAADTLHQVIVYGDVQPDALDSNSPNWNEPTAMDAAQRTTDWLQNRNGFTNQSVENPNHHR